MLAKWERNIEMFVWKVDLVEHHIMGPEKWDANAESGYAAEVDGVLFETVASAAGGRKFQSREEAEIWRDQWNREFEASSGSLEIKDGEFHEVQVLRDWELVEL